MAHRRSQRMFKVFLRPFDGVTMLPEIHTGLAHPKDDR
jgi:hypothetical protein